jgi:formylglycine-generating enzyme required for sulfatase activity
LGAEPDLLVRRLGQEPDVSARRAILLSLGEFPIDAIAASSRQGLIDQLRKSYRNDTDPGIHCSVEWLFRRWGQEAELQSIENELVSGQPLNNRHWYVTEEGHTLAIIPEPGEFWMGSPGAEGERIAQEEAMHRARIIRSFAIATTEVTTAQFKRFLAANPRIRDSWTRNDGLDREPIANVTWFEAAQYCRWLSAQENVSKDQMCYPPIDDIVEGMKLPTNFLERSGYRMPTEEEWEYSCRGGTETGRPCADEVMQNYAWYVRNSDLHVHPVAQLKPNDFGLFDLLGNVGEWCHAHGTDSDHGARGTVAPPGKNGGPSPSGSLLCSWRGGSYMSLPSRTRSAAVTSYSGTARAPMLGFRIARSLR